MTLSGDRYGVGPGMRMPADAGRKTGTGTERLGGAGLVSGGGAGVGMSSTVAAVNATQKTTIPNSTSRARKGFRRSSMAPPIRFVCWSSPPWHER
jgi:hypothetical protein